MVRCRWRGQSPGPASGFQGAAARPLIDGGQGRAEVSPVMEVLEDLEGSSDEWRTGDTVHWRLSGLDDEAHTPRPGMTRLGMTAPGTVAAAPSNLRSISRRLGLEGVGEIARSQQASRWLSAHCLGRKKGRVGCTGWPHARSTAYRQKYCSHFRRQRSWDTVGVVRLGYDGFWLHVPVDFRARLCTVFTTVHSKWGR